MIPTASNSALAVARSASLACLPGAIAVAPAPTSAGVLGIARTTRTPSVTASSIASVSTPAAIDTTSVPARSSEPTSRSTLSRICGLTLSTTSSAPRATSRLSVVIAMP